tara:strand:- start:275 stop:448 length:174 start_codon:yes stop_codon:yes gene_type:complete
MMIKVKEIKELKKLLIKYLEPYNPETDCYDKWMETVQDDIYDLLSDTLMNEDYDETN